MSIVIDLLPAAGFALRLVQRVADGCFGAPFTASAGKWALSCTVPVIRFGQPLDEEITKQIFN
ncbi:hypothetical protein [Thalassovita gelatinovora]|uniref:hypothetical protein n=1 Tax=Thalassovita gelatinovora TaxID=53501 RepID=UPI00130E53F4|nr:hypothetical protein [Thalassovita gelatinovora]QIZ79632.1 hypothetical protein HFZ77_03635 [Thalassovita gelatinovora]